VSTARPDAASKPGARKLSCFAIIARPLRNTRWFAVKKTFEIPCTMQPPRLGSGIRQLEQRMCSWCNYHRRAYNIFPRSHSRGVLLDLNHR
jgi:hypothetical protein